MLIMVVGVICELGIMHLPIGALSYKIASCVLTQALGRINEIPMRVGKI
jgi:hypothetical protein